MFVFCLAPPRQKEGEWEATINCVSSCAHKINIIVQKLTNALALDYPHHKLEILVGSDSSSDETVLLANSFASQGIKVFSFTQRRGKASVLNDLVKAATGEVLLLCDANVMFRAD